MGAPAGRSSGGAQADQLQHSSCWTAPRSEQQRNKAPRQLPLRQQASQAEERIAEERRWAQVRQPLLQHSLHEWPTPDSTVTAAFKNAAVNVLLQQESSCAACAKCGAQGDAYKQVATRTVLWVSMQQQLLLELPVRQCTRCAEAGVTSAPATAQPIQLHSFPTTPVNSMQPYLARAHFLPVWLDLQLLHFLGQLRLRQPQASVEGFAAAILAQHAANGCVHIVSNNAGAQPAGIPTIAADSFRKLLSKASDEYAIIQFRRQELVRQVAEGSGGLEQSCPCCTDQPHSLSFDGNFKLAHLRTAATATQRPPAISLRLQPDSARDAFMQQPDSEACNAAAAEACNDFAADAALARTANKYDITAICQQHFSVHQICLSSLLDYCVDDADMHLSAGIGGVFCRHLFLYMALNFSTGEKWAYATFVLFTLMTTHNIVPKFFWYDINCRYRQHFLAWLDKQTGLPADLAGRARAMRFPLPPWHHYMHNATCQATNSSRTMEGAGRPAGEPPEMAWAYLGGFGLILQYMSLASRHEFLERLFAHWNASKLDSLVGNLTAMHTRALVELQQADAGLDDLRTDAAALGVSNLQWHELLRLPHEDQLDAAVPLTAAAEYAELRLICHYVDSAPAGPVPAELILGSNLGGRKLAPGSAYMRKSRQRLAALQRQLFAGVTNPCDFGSPQFKTALQALADHKISMLQLEASKLVQELQLVRLLARRVQGRREEQRRLRAVQDRHTSHVKSKVAMWAAWKRQQVGGVVPEDAERRVLDMDYPWAMQQSSSGVGVLRSKAHHLLDMRNRCNEEIALVGAELQQLQRTLQQRKRRLLDGQTQPTQVQAGPGAPQTYEQHCAVAKAAADAVTTAGKNALLREHLALLERVDVAAQGAAVQVSNAQADDQAVEAVVAAAITAAETVEPVDPNTADGVM